MTPNNMRACTVSAAWLQENSDRDDLIILDASMPPVGLQTPFVVDEFIQGARKFDIENVFSDPHSSLPHTLLPPIDFQNAVRALGVNSHSTVVVYDVMGVYSSARAWWNFKVMGHERVFVLDGGLPAWKRIGGPVVTVLCSDLRSGNFVADFQECYVTKKQHLLSNLSHSDKKVVDARSEGRFYGKEPEPREGLLSGHIPGSVNLPYTQCLTGGRLLDQDKQQQGFEALSFSPDDCLVVSCGSGLTACIVILAAYSAGYKNLSLYDGSWAEWGSDSRHPIDTV